MSKNSHFKPTICTFVLKFKIICKMKWFYRMW
jgi:hypothetical protein